MEREGRHPARGMHKHDPGASMAYIRVREIPGWWRSDPSWIRDRRPSAKHGRAW